MLFDITTPDTAYYFLLEYLQIDGDTLIHDYIVEFNKDIDEFYKKYEEHILSIDLNNLLFRCIHVTTNSDNCAEIKKNGLINLQKVLSGETALNRKLSQIGITFDINNKTFEYNNSSYEIDYDKLSNFYSWDLTGEQNKIRDISRKIYNDPQINGWFANSNVKNYGGRVHERPEFLFTLAKLIPETQEIIDEWMRTSKSYKIVYDAPFNQFTYYSFYDVEEQYNADYDKKELRYWLLNKALYIAFQSPNDSYGVPAYMWIKTDIAPHQIKDYIEI